MAITPAGAQVNQSVSKQWKKIFKKNIQPQTDKRYYTKKKTRQKFVTKKKSAAGDAAAQAGATAAANATTDVKLGNYWTKAESDSAYAPYPKTLRGTYTAETMAAGAGEFAFDTISYGATMTSAPTVVFVDGGTTSPTCTGSAAAPTAPPGHLCIYEGLANNADTFTFASPAGAIGVSSTFGTVVRFTSTAAGISASLGGWAVTPAADGVTAGPGKPGKAGSAGNILDD